MSEPIASCLVLVDWKGRIDVSNWMKLAQQFFGEAGVEPDACDYELEGKQRRGLKGLLEQIAERKNPESISLAATHPPHNDLRDWLAEAVLSQNEKRKYAAFCCDARGLDLEVGWFVELTQRMAALAGLQYGFAYQRSMSRGPVFYAGGFLYGQADEEIPEEEVQEITRWFHERLHTNPEKAQHLFGHLPFRHLDGMQRDVYPLNILTSKHLSRLVEGMPLEQWIARDKSKGWLQPIAEGVWGWVVPESSLPLVRQALEGAGLLIAKPHGV